MLKAYAESTLWQTQAQQAHTVNVLSDRLFCRETDGLLDAMCDAQLMLEQELPGGCNHVVCTISGQCADFMFNVPLLAHASAKCLACLHQSKHATKVPTVGKIICCDPEVTVIPNVSST